MTLKVGGKPNLVRVVWVERGVEWMLWSKCFGVERSYKNASNIRVDVEVLLECLWGCLTNQPPGRLVGMSLSSVGTGLANRGHPANFFFRQCWCLKVPIAALGVYIFTADLDTIHHQSLGPTPT
jgi:hypothetical protein